MILNKDYRACEAGTEALFIDICFGIYVKSNTVSHHRYLCRDGNNGDKVMFIPMKSQIELSRRTMNVDPEDFGCSKKLHLRGINLGREGEIRTYFLVC